MAIPKALEPTGVVLVDKPAGPSSFHIVARVRGRTGAKTGHAGTLDPFATGLLVLLSGRATSLQDRFMKLDKRYVTDVDLRARTTTGDPEGDVLEEHEPPSRDELESSLAGAPRRGRAADSGSVGGEDRRRARLSAAPTGCRRRDADARHADPRASSWSRTRPASPGSTSSSAPGPTSDRSLTRSAAIAPRSGGRGSARSASRRLTRSVSCRSRRRFRGWRRRR